jgi:hypothetical protein
MKSSPEALKREINAKAPGISVKTFDCPHTSRWHVTLECHSMRLYQSNMLQR